MWLQGAVRQRASCKLSFLHCPAGQWANQVTHPSNNVHRCGSRYSCVRLPCLSGPCKFWSLWLWLQNACKLLIY